MPQYIVRMICSISFVFSLFVVARFFIDYQENLSNSICLKDILIQIPCNHRDKYTKDVIDYNVYI